MTNVRRKRILHLTGILNCGGAENMLMGIYRHVDRSKVAFSFLVHTNNRSVGYFDKEVKELGGDIFYINSQGCLGPWRYILALKKLLVEQGPFDIVHSHLDWQGGLIALAARLAKVPHVIVHAHTSQFMGSVLSVRIFLPVQKWLIRRFANECWACSREAGDFISSGKKSFRIVPNAIDVKRFVLVGNETRDARRAEWDCEERTLVLVHAGSFSQVKNQEFLIEIAICLERRSVDYRLILCGKNDNEYGNRMKGRVRAAGLSDRILFLGVRDDLHLVFAACDWFLFPSLFEGLGIVCVEAQAAGLCCVLSPGIPCEVDMGLGLTKCVERMIPHEWAQEVLMISRNPTPKRQTILNSIRKKGYDIEHNVLEIEESYLSC